MTIRDVIKEKKGEAVTIALLDTKDVHGTIVSVHMDFFVLSVGDVKGEHIIFRSPLSFKYARLPSTNRPFLKKTKPDACA